MRRTNIYIFRRRSNHICYVRYKGEKKNKLECSVSNQPIHSSHRIALYRAFRKFFFERRQCFELPNIYIKHVFIH